MKKRVLITAATAITVLILFNAICLQVYANGISENPYVFDEEEFKEIQKNIGTEEILGYLGEEKVAVKDVAYRYFFIQSEALRDSALSGENIDACISNDRHVWAVPMSQSTVFYSDVSGEWKFEMATNYPADGRGETVDNAEVLEAVRNITMGREKLIMGPVYFRAAKYSTMFAYFRTDKEQYLVPYSAVSRFTELQNGKLYTAKDAMEIMEENYPIPEEEENVDPSLLGDYRSSIREPIPEEYLTAAVGTLAMKGSSSSKLWSVLAIGNILIIGAATGVLIFGFARNLNRQINRCSTPWTRRNWMRKTM